MKNLYERFSSKENLKQAYLHIKDEIRFSSLSVDPINQPMLSAIETLGDSFFDALELSLRNGEYEPESGYFVYLPKDNLGVRPVCVLSLVDKIVYQAIFNKDILGTFIDGQLSNKSCFGNRIENDPDNDYYFVYYGNNWEAFCKAQKDAFDDGYTWKLEFDIQQYFENIPVKKLIEAMRSDFQCKDEKMLELLSAQLIKWSEYTDLHTGIPQGLYASGVLGNVYLSFLDRYIEDNFLKENIRYFRYADDIVLMGKDKNDVLQTTEKIVSKLRKMHLSLNEKTRLVELEDTEEIERMMFIGDYSEEIEDVPEDEITRISKEIPWLLEKMTAKEPIDKIEFRELKYFLKVDREYNPDMCIKLLEIIGIYQSLTSFIVPYLSDARRQLGFPYDSVFDDNLWKIYNDQGISRWTKFWVFKYLISNNVPYVEGFEAEVRSIIQKPESSIFKVVAYYYMIINEEKIDIELVLRDMRNAETSVEKSIFASFLFPALSQEDDATKKSQIEKLLSSDNHDLNIIGSVISKEEMVKYSSGITSFSKRLLSIEPEKKDKKKETVEMFSITLESETPIRQKMFSDPEKSLGVTRKKRGKHTVDLGLEKIDWSKLSLRFEDGMMDLKIYFEDKFLIQTSYIELGFWKNKKNVTPKMAWHMLKALSVFDYKEGSVPDVSTLAHSMASYSNKEDGVGHNSVHQHKKTLTAGLQNIFKTSTEPITHDDFWNGYKPLFDLQPSPDLRHEDVFQVGGKYNDNIDNKKDDVEDVTDYLDF